MASVRRRPVVGPGGWASTGARAWGVLPMDHIAVSVEDPEGFIEALKPAIAAVKKKPARRSSQRNGGTTRRRTRRKAE